MSEGFLGTISGQVRLDIKEAVAAYAKIRADNARTVYALRGTGDAFVHSGKTMAYTGGILVAAFGLAVKAAAEFERKMDFFGAITDTNGKKLQKLSAFTLQLAQDTIYSADQVAEAFIELGKAGIKADEITAGVGKAVTSLGAATDIPLVNSAQIIISTMSQFSIEAKNAAHITDVLAGAANASLADIEDIGVALKYVGGVAKVAGLSLEDTSTAIAILANRGIRGSTAGTSLRQTIVSFGGATKPAIKELKKLGIITEDGTNRFYDQKGNLKKLSVVYQIMQDAMKNLNGHQKTLALRTIFNNRAIATNAILTAAGAKGFAKMNAEIKKTDAADIAHKRLDNLSGDIEILKGNIETFLVRAGTPFQNTLRGWVQNITKLVQAFGNLDPKMQKFIVQGVGMAGSALVIMGIFNIIVGTIFRFVASMLKLGAALSFVWDILVAVGEGISALIIGLAAGTTGAIIAAVVIVVLLLAGAFILAYKKIKVFRDAMNRVGEEFMKYVVDPIVAGTKAVIGWIKKVAEDPGAAWDSFKKSTVAAVKAVGRAFAALPGLIVDGLQATGRAVLNFANLVWKFFLSIPGRVLKLMENFVGLLQKIFTFKNLGRLLGLVIDLIVARFVALPILLLTLALKAVGFVQKAFATLAPKVAFAIGFLIGRAIKLWVQFQIKLWTLTGRLVTGVIKFFLLLPGRINSAMQAAVTAFITGLGKLIAWAWQNGPRIAAGIMTAINNLPGQVATLLINVGTSLINAVPGIIANATAFGQAFFTGVWSMIQGLPGLIAGLLQNCINAFLDVIDQAFHAAESVGSSLWKGFKKGIGLNSPSYIEKAMFQVNRTMGEETKKLRRHTVKVQDISRKMANTQFSPGTTTSKLLDTVATTQAVQAKITASSAAAPTTARRSSTPKQPAGAGVSRLVAGKLKIDQSGTAFITGLAEDVNAGQDQLNSEANRRNRED